MTRFTLLLCTCLVLPLQAQDLNSWFQLADQVLTDPDGSTADGWSDPWAVDSDWLGATQTRFQLTETEGGGSADSSTASEDAQIAEAMLNPLSYLWLLFTQNDTYGYDGDALDALGEDTKIQNVTLLMPVLAMQLTETWKMIFRPVIPIASYDTVKNINIDPPIGPGNSLDNIGVDFERKTGLGDIVLWTAFSNQYKPPMVWGFGTTVMLDTATDDRLGTGKWSAGPMALVFNITEKWVLGTIAQHWWSFAGSDTTTVTIETEDGRQKVRRDRPDVSLTDIQPVIRYRVSPVTNIGMAPNWRYDWESDQATIPIGGGFDTLIKVGSLPAKIGVEAYYYVEQADAFGPEWQLRLVFVPVVPSPAWSKEPLF